MSTRTGRTTRMLNHAAFLAKAGRAVFVLATPTQCELFKKWLAANHPDASKSIDVGHYLSNFDWQAMKLLGAHPNCVVLVDHNYIEQKFQAALKALHEYDTESDTGWHFDDPVKIGPYRVRCGGPNPNKGWRYWTGTRWLSLVNTKAQCYDSFKDFKANPKRFRSITTKHPILWQAAVW